MTARLKAALEELREARKDWLADGHQSLFATRNKPVVWRLHEAIDAVLAAAEAEDKASAMAP